MMMKTFIAVWHRRNAARVAFECVQAANHAVNQSVERREEGGEGVVGSGGGGAARY